MMRMPMIGGGPEVSYLKKFFDGIDQVITDEMQAGKTLMEEGLTFVLARVLDGQSTFQKILEYPIDDLNKDLEKCNSGTQLSIDFETNEHKKYFESSVSHADLGIVLKQERSVFGSEYKKAIIIQSKKLYPGKEQYNLFCGYDAFSPEQFVELKKLGSKYGSKGVCYFLYNPKADAFSEDEAKVIMALETRMLSIFSPANNSMPFWHPDMDYMFHKFDRRGIYPFQAAQPSINSESADQLLEKRNKIVSQKPGLRVLGVTDVSNLVTSADSVKNTFRLHECYKYALSDRWMGNSSAIPFLSLSSFIVDLLMGCSHGSDNENLIRIAEGKLPEESNDEKELPKVAAKHTIKITINNTLPSMPDLSFVQQ